MKKHIEDFILKVYSLHPHFLFVVNFMIFLLLVAFLTPSVNQSPEFILRLKTLSLTQTYLNKFAFLKNPVVYLIFSIVFGALVFLGNIFLSWVGIPLFYISYFFIENMKRFTYLFTGRGTLTALNLPEKTVKGFSVYFSTFPANIFEAFGYFISLAAGLFVLIYFSVFMYRIIREKFPKIKALWGKIVTFVVFILIPHLIILFFILREVFKDIKVFSLRVPFLVVILVYLVSVGSHFFSLVGREVKKGKDKKPSEFLSEGLTTGLSFIPIGLTSLIIGIILKNTLSFRILLPLFEKINPSSSTLLVLNIIGVIVYALSIMLPFWYVFYNAKRWSKKILNERKISKKKRRKK
ncbi:MAG: hypothetical protein J7J33_01835 [Caldisericia bacterium]|nr:hypothetical protein [Caldisericia bacterium]